MKTSKTSVLALIVAVATCFIMSGCARTLPLDYQPNLSNITSVKSSTSLKLGAITDSRGTNNPRIIEQTTDMIPTQIGLLPVDDVALAERPITDIIQNAVRDALVKAGYKISTKGKYTLTGNLLKLDFQPTPGWFSVSMQLTTQIKFRLINDKSGIQVWTQVYTSVTNFTGTGRDLHKKTFAQAIDNIITNLVNSKSFRSALCGRQIN